MGRCGKEVLNEITLLVAAPGNPAAAAALASVCLQRRALDVALACNRNRDLLFRDEVFIGVVFRRLNDPGAPRITKFLFGLRQLFDNQPQNQLLAGENRPVARDGFMQLVELFLQLLALKPRQAAQLHYKDLVCLDLGEPMFLHQPGLCLLVVLRRTNQGNHLVDDLERLQEALDDMRTLLRLAQQVAGAAANDFHPVAFVLNEKLLEAERLGPAPQQRNINNAEGSAELGELEELVDHHIRRSGHLEFDHKADVFVALISNIGDVLNAAIFHAFGNLLDDGDLVFLVGNLGKDDAVLVLALFNVIGRAHLDQPPPRPVGLPDSAAPADLRPRGEVRPGNVLHQLID